MNRTSSLRRILALLAMVALIAAACGDDSDDGNEEGGGETTTSTTTTEPGTTAPIPEEGEALVDLQIQVVEFGDAGFVEIVNNGDSDADLNGIFGCQFPTYVDLGTVIEGGTLAAGATAQIPAAELGGLDAAVGEAALYQGDSFGSADAILAYVQWGEAGQERAAVAAEANIWPSADVAVTPDPNFNSIESGGDPADPENWS